MPEREDYEALAMSGILHKAIQKTKKNGDSFEIAFLHSVDGKKGKKETKVSSLRVYMVLVSIFGYQKLFSR